MQNCEALGTKHLNDHHHKEMTLMGDTTPIPAESTGPTVQQKLTAFAILDAKHKADGALLAEARRILQGELEDDWRETGSKSRVLRVGDRKIATATVNENGDTVEVTDKEAYLRWVEANYPTEVEYVLISETRTVVKEAFSKSHLSTKRLEVMLDGEGKPVLDDDGQPIIVDKVLTGLPVEGVRIKKGEGIKSFAIRAEKGVDVAALAAGHDFSVLYEPRAIGSSDVIEGETVPDAEATFVADVDGTVQTPAESAAAQDIVDAEVVDDDEVPGAA